MIKHPTEIYELEPKYSRKSFYKKAFVIVLNGFRYLRSYDTIVCGKNIRTGELHRYYEGESVTTRRHLAAFLDYDDYHSYFKLKVEKRPLLTIVI